MIIGLTGYFGSGKTTVGQIFKQLGAHFINADEVVHDLYKPGKKGWKAIKRHFGQELFRKNHTIDRHKLAEMAFAKPALLKKLESLIHPLVIQEIRQIIKHIRKQKTSPMIVIESIKFPEASFGTLIDKLLVVSCPRAKIYERNKHRYHKKDIAYILKSQTIGNQIDYTVNNGSSIGKLGKKVRAVYDELS